MNTTSPAQEALAAEIRTTMEGQNTGLRAPMIGLLARAEAAEQIAQKRVAELEAEIQRLRTEQITDGEDPRLARFWDKAGRIADHADFCEEYDRMAEAMNGPRRAREYNVDLTVTLTVTLSRTVEAVSEEDAEEIASDGLSRSDLEGADVSIDDWELDSASAERA